MLNQSRIESRETSDLHFNETIYLADEKKKKKDWRGRRQDGLEINTEVHVRDGRTELRQ